MNGKPRSWLSDFYRRKLSILINSKSIRTFKIQCNYDTHGNERIRLYQSQWPLSLLTSIDIQQRWWWDTYLYIKSESRNRTKLCSRNSGESCKKSKKHKEVLNWRYRHKTWIGVIAYLYESMCTRRIYVLGHMQASGWMYTDKMFI